MYPYRHTVHRKYVTETLDMSEHDGWGNMSLLLLKMVGCNWMEEMEYIFILLTVGS